MGRLKDLRQTHIRVQLGELRGKDRAMKSTISSLILSKVTNIYLLVVN